MRPLPICSLLYRTANTAIKNRWLKVLPSMNAADQTGFVHHRYLYIYQPVESNSIEVSQAATSRAVPADYECLTSTLMVMAPPTESPPP